MLNVALLLVAFGYLLLPLAWFALLGLAGLPAQATGAERWPLLLLVLIQVLLAPALEELLFRAGLTRLLLKRLPVRAAIVSSALIFALAHGTREQIGHAFVLGLLTATVYSRTGRLGPCILLHVAANGFPVLLTQLSSALWPESPVAGGLETAASLGWMAARTLALGVGLALLHRTLGDWPAEARPRWRQDRPLLPESASV